MAPAVGEGGQDLLSKLLLLVDRQAPQEIGPIRAGRRAVIRVHSEGCPLCGKPLRPGESFCDKCAKTPVVKAGTRIAEGILSANEGRVKRAAGRPLI